MNVTTIGLDIAKNVFQVHGVEGKVVVRKSLRRGQVLGFFANLGPCVVGLEACAGAHYRARELGKLGHEVELISPQFVKPYVKGNQNDKNDAEAICEAVGRPDMRFVPVKSGESQDIPALHRVRSGLVKERTAQANRLRGLLGEYGIVIGQGLARLRKRLPEILEDGENGLSGLVRELFADLHRQILELDRQVATYGVKLQSLYRGSAACQRIGRIPGVGPITASAVAASLGDGRAFESGRQVAAWPGLVPRQDASGGKPGLPGISKRGDTYLRTLLIHGARSVVKVAAKKTDARSRWINDLVQRRNKNIAAVAPANKNARALLRRGEDYRAPFNA